MLIGLGMSPVSLDLTAHAPIPRGAKLPGYKGDPRVEIFAQ
jgi:hypothetical protein